MSRCVYPGSFDPVTKGHLDIIRKASMLFDHVTVTVMINVHKNGMIPPEKRVLLLRKSLQGFKNIDVELWNGLLADYMKKKQEICVVRGIRNSSDFEAEMTAAAINRQLNPSIQTVMIPSDLDLSYVSSSAVREIVSFGGDPRPFLPDEAAEEIMNALSK